MDESAPIRALIGRHASCFPQGLTSQEAGDRKLLKLDEITDRLDRYRTAVPESDRQHALQIRDLGRVISRLEHTGATKQGKEEQR